MIKLVQQLKNSKHNLLIWLQSFIEKKINTRWYNFPLGRKPRASYKKYIQLAEEVKNKNYTEVDEYEKITGYTIDKDWIDELALHTQVVIKDSPLCYAHGRVLYSSLSKYLDCQTGNSTTSKKERITIWETGTARGFSTLCMAAALSDQKRAGVIVTFDLFPHDKKMYWNCIDDHENPKTRRELLLPWRSLVENYIIFHQGDTRLTLPKIQTNRINFAFLDGAHTYEDVIFEFDQIRDKQLPGDMIVYDDYTPSQFPGLARAVDEICECYHYHRIDLKAHYGRGYVVATKE
jgi:hypothetical protein